MILFPKEESYRNVLVGNAKKPLLYFLTTHLPHTLNLTKGKKKFCCYLRNSLSTLILCFQFFMFKVFFFFFFFFFCVTHTFWATGLRFLPFCFSKWTRSLKSRGLSSLQKQCPSPAMPVITSCHCESPASWSSSSPCYLTTPTMNRSNPSTASKGGAQFIGN